VIQALIKSYKGLITPNLLLDLLSRDGLARLAGKKGENLERLRREVNEHSGLAQFPAFGV
jgi:hypothetical protein